jgi:hypothetical protein
VDPNGHVTHLPQISFFFNILTFSRKPLYLNMAAIQESVLLSLARDFAELPSCSEMQLAQMYNMTVREIKDIIYSDLFKEKVGEIRMELAKQNSEGTLQERLESKGKTAALSRLFVETNNEVDGTPATRISASKAMLEHSQTKQAGALLAIELSPEKFRMILGTGNLPTKMPDIIRSPEDLEEVL